MQFPLHEQTCHVSLSQPSLSLNLIKIPHKRVSVSKMKYLQTKQPGAAQVSRAK